MYLSRLLVIEAEPFVIRVFVFSEHEHLNLLADFKAISHLLDKDLGLDLTCLLVLSDVLKILLLSVVFHTLQLPNLYLLDGRLDHIFKDDKAVVVNGLDLLVGQFGSLPGVEMLDEEVDINELRTEEHRDSQ